MPIPVIAKQGAFSFDENGFWNHILYIDIGFWIIVLKSLLSHCLSTINAPRNSTAHVTQHISVSAEVLVIFRNCQSKREGGAGWK